jgi:hypothetical protein
MFKPYTQPKKAITKHLLIVNSYLSYINLIFIKYTSCHGCDVVSYVRPKRFGIASHFTLVNQRLRVSVRPLTHAHTCIYCKIASIAFSFFSFPL